MFKIDRDGTIHLTRGDVAPVEIRADDINGEPYKFAPGDVVCFRIFERKDCNCVVLTKEKEVREETESVTVFLDNGDTKIGDMINKPKDYWYEVELNPGVAPQTIIGYDENGPKVLRLYPEGKVITE